jgi:hypothetical protein
MEDPVDRVPELEDPERSEPEQAPSRARETVTRMAGGREKDIQRG